jgi:hypothetical protein
VQLDVTRYSHSGLTIHECTKYVFGSGMSCENSKSQQGCRESRSIKLSIVIINEFVQRCVVLLITLIIPETGTPFFCNINVVKV